MDRKKTCHYPNRTLRNNGNTEIEAMECRYKVFDQFRNPVCLRNEDAPTDCNEYDCEIGDA